MSLTYHPFEHVPALDEIGKSLRKNVSSEERSVSGLLGLLLIGVGHGRESSLAKYLLVGAGAALIGRAWTGHCPLYEELDVRQARQRNLIEPAKEPGQSEAAA